MKLTATRLMVTQFDKTFEFYSEILELPVTWGARGDVYASFGIAGQEYLSLFKAELMEEHIQHVTENRHNIQDKIMLTFAVDNLDQWHTTLTEKGIQCINTPHNMPGWGIRCLHLRDPEGNLIELNQELPKEQWNDDLLKDAEKYNE